MVVVQVEVSAKTVCVILLGSIRAQPLASFNALKALQFFFVEMPRCARWDISASVVVDGEPVEEFCTSTQGNVVSTWIASEVGKVRVHLFQILHEVC